MEYFLTFFILFALELIYFRIADKYNIIDKPNHRSAHTEITLRGGGIIFPIAFLIFSLKYYFSANSLLAPQNFLIFGLGLLIICTISFIDDVIELSSKTRLIFHFIAVSLLLYFANAFVLLPIWIIFLIYIFAIGILNAYNFMDGINGMTGIYSLVALISLLYVNSKIEKFTDNNFIIYPILACLVFLFFNFRKKAKCFMGDVGSFGIAFWIIALLSLLIMKSGELKWILFLTVYGTEVVITIFERIRLHENIFEAHRRHLYQLFANEKKVSHLVVSSFYAFFQLIINFFLIFSTFSDWVNFIFVVVPSVIVYTYVKLNIQKQLLTGE